MTTKQSTLYWRSWSAARRVLIDYGGFSAADADAERHNIHRDALGEDKSSTSLTNRDLDIILDHFRAISTITDGPQTGPTRAQDQPRRRLIWAIEKTGLGDAYLGSVSQDIWSVSDWRTLSETQLSALRFTAVSRARAKARKVATP